MNKKLFIATLIFCLFFLLGTSIVCAQEQKLEPEAVEIKTSGLYTPRLLPDHPLYFVKTSWEKVRLAFTFDKLAKVKYQLNLAEKRIAEASALIKKDKSELAEKSMERYRVRIDKILVDTQESKEKGKDVDVLVEKLSRSTLRHQEVMAGVYEKVPEQAKEAIEKVIEVSKRGHEQAVEAISSPAKRKELIETAKTVGQRVKEALKGVPEALENRIEKGLEKLESEVSTMDKIEEPEKIREGVEAIQKKAENVQ